MISNKKRAIAYVSGTRADFGLMTPVLESIRKHVDLKLHLYVTGMHLLKEFGNTIDYVKGKFSDCIKIPAVIDSDNRVSTLKFASNLINKISTIFNTTRPDLVIVLGDRVEMLSVAIAGTYLGIPIGHLHGGEKTSTVDDQVRHAITKLSHIHFPATKKSAERIIKLGEEPWRIHPVGAPSLDMIKHLNIPKREYIEKKFNLKKQQPFILITLHPVSEKWQEAAQQMKLTIESALEFKLPLLISCPNTDPGGRAMISVIKYYSKRYNFIRPFPSLSYETFLALEKYTSVWIGNSSAGIIESPSFKIPVVNIGERQANRERSTNIIDAPYNKKQIINEIKKSLNDKKFLRVVSQCKNSWGDGHTGQRVANLLAKLPINEKLLAKKLNYD